MVHTSTLAIARKSQEFGFYFEPQNIRLSDIRTINDLALFLKVKPMLLHWLSDSSHAGLYTTFIKKKKSGGERKIHAPIGPLKEVQRRIASALKEIYKPKPSVHGFADSKSIVTNSFDHTGKKWVFNIDLLDFFPALNFGRVRGMLMGKPYFISGNIATILARICCYENSLPQGAPSSPIISNMICGAMDSALQKLAKDLNCMYTRYADDITFSCTQSRFPSALGLSQILDGTRKIVSGKLISRIILDNGFKINQAKTRLQSKFQGQVVTGLKVNSGPNVKRDFVKGVRGILHAWEKFGYANAEAVFHSKYYSKQRNPIRKPPSLENVTRGRIQFVKMVRGEKDLVYRKLANWFYKLTGQEEKSYFLAPTQEIEAALWVLESDDGQGSAFMVLDGILVSCQHVLGRNLVAFRPSAREQKFQVETVAENEALDLAVLRITGARSFSLSFGKSSVIAHGETLTVAGFPDFGVGSGVQIFDAKVTGFRIKSTIKRIVLDTPIFRGNSGGPVLNKNNKVIGVAVTGAENVEMARDGAEFGVIPISALSHLKDPIVDAILNMNDFN